jgi:amino acid transporter
VPGGLRRNTLSTWGLFFFAVSASAPETAVLGGIVAAIAVGGPAGVPAAFVVLTGGLLLFAVGYVSVGQKARHAGPLYAYVARGLGPVRGVSAAAVALLSYAAITACLFGFVGVTLASFSGGSWWVWALVAWAIIGWFGTLPIRTTAKALAILLCFDLAVVLAFIGYALTNPVDGSVDWSQLCAGALAGDGIGSKLALGVACFVGVELIMTFSEEAVSHSTLKRATFGGVIFLGALYALAGLAVIAATGAAAAQDTALTDGPQIIFNVLHDHLGILGMVAAQLFLCSSIVAAQTSFHQTGARYLFALHREGLLKGLAGRMNRHSGAPVGGSLIMSAVSLVVIAVWAGLGLDPMLLFTSLAALAAVGIMSLVAACCIATMGYYRKGGGPGHTSVWVRVVAPLTGAVAMGAIVAVTVTNMHALTGAEPGSFAVWLLPLVVGATAVIGAVWGWTVKLRDKQTLTRIGMGQPEPLAVPAAHFVADGMPL